MESFSKKFVRRKTANIRIYFVPFYDGGWKKRVFNEVVIGFHGRKIFKVTSGISS